MTFIIDTDVHITEPADVWTSRMASSWGDLVPRVERDATGADFWMVNGKKVFPAGTSIFYKDEHGNRRMDREAFPSLPRSFDEMHPSAYDAAARLEVMDDYGIYAAALYPNLGLTVSDIYLAAGPDAHDFKIAAMKAYNDFLVEWSSGSGGRLIPLACVPFFDVEASVAEIERVATMGHKGLVITGAPQVHGQPYFGDPHWDPMWAAAEASGLPVSFHIGGGDMSRHYSPERRELKGELACAAFAGAAFFFENAMQALDIMTSGILPKYPGLKFVIVESGIGWIPFALEAVDDIWRRYRVDREHPEYDGLPSDYFRRQIYANYWFEKLRPWHLELVGADNILFETDFPHVTCFGKEEMESAIESGFADVDQEIKDKILWKNAAKLYNIEIPADTPVRVA